MKRFRIVLPVAQSVLALILGGIGEWQRRRILSGSSIFFSDGWHSSARFHVWPWPLKFAVITNAPPMLPGMLLSLLVAIASEEIAGIVLLILAILSGPAFWYWIGSRFDRRWTLKDRKPWIALSLFNLIALAGSLIDLGNVGYIPFGFVLWIFWAMTAHRVSWRFPKPVIVGRTGPWANNVSFNIFLNGEFGRFWTAFTVLIQGPFLTIQGCFPDGRVTALRRAHILVR